MPTLRTRLISLWVALVGAPSGRDQIGNRGERAASRFLKDKQFRILARNVRVRFGEADLLCLAPDRRTIVVVEVKTRRVEAPDRRPYLPPEASITQEKRRKLTAVMNHLARANRWRERPLRIDVVAVEWPPDGRPVIRHHEGVIHVRP